MNASTLREPKQSLWPYAIGGYFAVAITGIVIFITWAVTQTMDLVRPDYYEQEILFQKHIDAAARTKELGASAGIKFHGQALNVQVPAAHLSESFRGQLHLYRPSDARLDRHLKLEPDENGHQVINTASLASGLWKARAEWMANGESYVSEATLVLE